MSIRTDTNRSDERLHLYGILLLVLASLFVYFSIEVRRYLGFHMFADLATFNQLLWNMVTRNKVVATVDMSDYSNYKGTDFLEVNYFGLHFRPILYLMAIPYNFYRHPLTIVFIRNLILSLGAIPIYLISCSVFNSRAAGRLFAVAYLVNPVFLYLQFQIPFPKLFFCTFSLFGFWFVLTKRYLLYFLCAVLGLFCDLRVAVVLFIAGIYLYFLKERRVGILTILISIAWFLISIWVLSSASLSKGVFGDMTHGQIFENYGFLKSSPLAAVRHIFSFDNFIYVSLLFASSGFVSLLSPITLGLAIPQLAMNLITPKANLISGNDTYAILPFFVLAAIFGLHRIYTFAASKPRHLWRGWTMAAQYQFQTYPDLQVGEIDNRIQKRYLLWGLPLYLVVITLLMTYAIGPRLDISVSRRDKRCLEILKTRIPPSASLLVTNFIAPHLSSRKAISDFTNKTIKSDYIVLDLTNYYHYDKSSSRVYYEGLKQRLSSGYGVYFFEEGLLILKQGFKNPQGIRQIFTSEADPVKGPISNGKEFGPGIKLVSIEVSRKGVLHPGDRFYFILYWEVDHRLVKGPLLIKGIRLKHKIKKEVSLEVEEPYEAGFGFLDILASQEQASTIFREYHCVNHLRRRTIRGDYSLVIDTPIGEYLVSDVSVR